MKKIFLLLILLFAFYLGGCNNEPIENKTNTIITTTTESPKYNVIFDFLDSDIENISIKVDVNSIIPLEKIPSIPDKKGYTSKWLYDNEYITKDNTIIEVSYEPIIYTINYYNIDKNIENPNPISYIIEDENIVLSDISKNGYEFIGWNNGGSYVTEVDPKECIDIYLSPSFEIIEYTITYNLNDIIDSEDEEEVKKYKAYNSNPEKYTVESSFTFNEPTRLGFTFTGWEKEEIEKGTTGDIILNARWEVAKYKVTVTNNLTDSIEETILEYGNSFEFEPTLVEGYTICTIKENDTIVDPNIDFINKDHSYIVYYISTDYEFEIQEFKEYITSSMYYTLKYITMTGYKGTSRNITIPDVIEAIGSKVISEDYPIDTITIGSNIKVIDYAAFDTSSLKAIYIPKTVKTIENDAFRFDDVVVFFEGTMEEWDKYDYMDIGYTKGIVVPNSTYSEMTYVKNENKSYILKDNKAYGYIDIDTTNTIYDFNNETVEIISIGKSFLSGCSNIKIIVIPDKVETIYFKSSNTYLFIPKSIKNIYYNYANYLYEGSIEDFSKVSVDSIYDTKIVYNIIPSNPSFIKTDDYEY